MLEKSSVLEYNNSKKPGMFVAGEKLTTEFSQGARVSLWMVSLLERTSEIMNSPPTYKGCGANFLGVTAFWVFFWRKL